MNPKAGLSKAIIVPWFDRFLMIWLNEKEYAPKPWNKIIAGSPEPYILQWTFNPFIVINLLSSSANTSGGKVPKSSGTGIKYGNIKEASNINDINYNQLWHLSYNISIKINRL